MINYGRQSIDENDINTLTRTLKQDLLTTGDMVDKFEQDLANYCNVKYAVCVSSGTSALMLSAKILLQENDEVLTTPNSFIATSNAILFAKAEPVFVDIDEYANINLDLCEMELKKNPNIKAIFAVAFSGHMLDQDKLEYLKKTYNIKILEDLAHSIGAKQEDIKAGSCKNSDISIFSFHPVKHITTGEGGAITTNSKEIYEKLLSMRNHSITKNKNMKPWEYEIHELSFNYRLSDIQCSLGVSQLKKLPMFIEKRIQIAKKYDEEFKNTIIKPLYTFDNLSSYHLYIVRVDFNKTDISKEELFIKMKSKGINLQVHYIPINKQPYYKSLGYGNEDTPKMDKYYQECFSLPIYPELKEEEQIFTIEMLKNYIKQSQSLFSYPS